MKYIKLNLILVLLFSLSLWHEMQAQTWQWADNGNGFYRSWDIVVDNNDQSYMIGTDYTTGPGTNLLVQNYSPAGLLSWTATASHNPPYAGGNEGWSIAEHGNNIYVTGTIEGETPNINIPGVVLPPNLHSSSHIFVGCLSKAGNWQWVNFGNADSLNGSGSGYGITVDQNGNVYITGEMEGTIRFHDAPGSSMIFQTLTAGAPESFVAMYDPNGILQWVFNSSMASRGLGIDVSNTSEIYVSGYVNTHPQNDLFLGKVDPSTLNYSCTFITGNTQFDEANDILVDNNGDIYITGEFSKTVNFGGTSLSSVLGSPDLFLAKYSDQCATSGGFSLQWVEFYGSAGLDYGTAMALDNCNYLYVNGVSDLGPGGSGLVMRYDLNGTFQGNYNFYGDAVESNGISIGPSNDLYLTGHFYDTLTLGSTMLIAGTSNNDDFIAKLDYAPVYSDINGPGTVTLYGGNHQYTGQPSGGSFSGPGISSSGLFDPLAAGQGTHTIWYHFNDGCGNPDSTSKSINVNCYAFNDTTFYYKVLNDTFIKHIHWHRNESEYFLYGDYNNILMTGTIKHANGDEDICVASFRKGGSVNWIRQYGGLSKDRGNSVLFTSSNEIIVAGITASFGNGTESLYLMKLDITGNVIWLKTYGSNQHANIANVEELEDGNFAVVSYHNGWKHANQDHDLIVLVTDPDGNQITYHRHDVTNRVWEYLKDVEPTKDGGFIVCGGSGHNWDYTGGIVMKFDASGNLDWEQEYRGRTPSGNYDLTNSNSRTNLFLNSIKQKPDSNYIVAGRLSDHDQYGTNATFKHGFLMELDQSGNVDWSKIYVADTFSAFYDLEMISNDEVLVAGAYNQMSSTEQSYILHIGQNWQPNFAKTFGNGVKNRATTIHEATNSDIVVTGFTGPSSDSLRAYVVVTDDQAANGCFTDQQIIAVDTTIDELTPHLSMVTYTDTVTYNLSGTDRCVEILDGCEYMIERMAHGTQPNPESKHNLTSTGMASNSLTKFHFYPNPANQYVRVEWNPRANESIHIKLMDLKGQQLLDHPNITSSNHQLDLSDIPKGIYIIQILQGEEYLNYKLVIQ